MRHVRAAVAPHRRDGLVVVLNGGDRNERFEQAKRDAGFAAPVCSTRISARACPQ
jgi:hypothetical protein